MIEFAVVTPWHREEEYNAFCDAWGVPQTSPPEWLVLQHDEHREGCGVTKNKGIRRAMKLGAEVVVVLDGDCYPTEGTPTLMSLVERHVEALEPQQVEMFQVVTAPPSRGTPYMERGMTKPVAASMGFWTEVGDYCAVRQLVHHSHGRPDEMVFMDQVLHDRYFPLCGMNLAFRPAEWDPWWQFIDVDRYDDIWMGWLWQREAYRRGACFNLTTAPLVRHSRQSNVWKNLVAEACYAEQSETLWREIATSPHGDHGDYESLLHLLPTSF